MSRLSDADVARIRELAAEGRSAAEVASEFSVSRQYIGEILRGQARPQIGGLDRELASGSVLAATESFLAGLDLGGADAVLAESARALAEKLDQVRGSDTGVAANAAPAIARQLLDVIVELRGTVEEPDWLDDLRRRREARRLATAATTDPEPTSAGT